MAFSRHFGSSETWRKAGAIMKINEILYLSTAEVGSGTGRVLDHTQLTSTTTHVEFLRLEIALKLQLVTVCSSELASCLT